MKKVPYGIFDYKKLKLEDYIYVDKTMYLSELENVASTIMYLRPGRFGKSLFTSMMYYYYDINSEYLFEDLFKDTYVYENKTPLKNSYYILKFDFSGITTNNMTYEELKQSFNRKVIDGLNAFLGYGFNFDIDMSIKEPNEILLSLLTHLRRLNVEGKLEHKVYIIIDEYDNFTNGILEGDTSLFKNVVNENGFVKSFYAIIKEYIGLGIIDRFFATGICPVTLNSMTTGFNISTDISHDIRFNSMVGLTHEEVRKLLNELELKEEEKENIFNTMLINYDGYLFNKKLDTRVFNATLVMYFLNYYKSFRSVPEILYDTNIVVNYGKIDNIIKIQNNKFYKELISEILETGEVTSELKIQFNLEEDFAREDIISLLYYFGYLTIDSENVSGNIIFKIPNLIMRETYGNYFKKILRDFDVVLDTEKIEEAIVEVIKDGKINKISEYVSEILKLSDNRILIKFDEKYIELLYFSLLINNNRFKVYTEYPNKNGYVDIMIIGNREYMDRDIMIELKYIKKSEYNERVYEDKKEEGRIELEKYSKDERINKKINKYLVVFVGNDLKQVEEIN